MKSLLLLLTLLFSVALRAQSSDGGKYIEVHGTSEREITADRIELLEWRNLPWGVRPSKPFSSGTASASGSRCSKEVVNVAIHDED